MTDFLPQSTDRLSDNTNAKSSNVIINDSISVTFATSGSIYLASTTLLLPIDTTYTINSYDAYVKLDFGAGGMLYYKIGYSVVTTAGAFQRCGYSYISLSTKPYAYNLTFVLEEASPIVPAVSATIYYIVYSTKLNG